MLPGSSRRIAAQRGADATRLDAEAVVPRKGLEPSRPLSHWHLKPARLPIPPPGPGRVSKDRSRACQIGELRAALLFFGPSPFRKTGAHFSGAVCKYTVQRGWVGVSRIR